MNFIVCLALLGYCFTLTRFSKCAIEYTPFFVVSSITTLLYFLAYANSLESGANAILIIGGFLFLLSPFLIWQEKKLLWEKYITPGFVISTLFLTLFLSLSYHAHFIQWDEFTHWGPHSKLVLLHNGFITASDMTVNKSYPLGGALFQYLFFRLSAYSEGTAYVAQCLLIMASLSIVVHQFQWHAWKKAFIAYALTVFLVSLMGVRIGPTCSLYMDGVAGIYFGMMMVAYFASRKSVATILCLLPIIVTMALLKPKMLPLVLMAAFVILLDQIISNRKNILLRIAAVAALPITSWLITLSWHHYLSSIGTPLARELNLTLAQIKNTLLAPEGSFSHTVIVNYLYALKSVVGFVAVIVVFNVITYLLYVSASHHKFKKINFIAINSALLLGFIAYLIGLLIMYLFTFSSYEAESLASMTRYLSIYRLGWALLTIYFLFDAIRSVKYRYSSVIERSIVAILLIALSVLISIHYLHPRNSARIWALQQPIIKIADAVKKVTQPQDKILTVWQNSKGFERAVLIYALTPRKFNGGCTSFGKPYSTGDIWTCNVTNEKLLQTLKGYDYLLLAYTDHHFWSRYQPVLPNRIALKPLLTYRICMGEGFDSFGKPGCRMQLHRAYLFKVIDRNGHIVLKVVNNAIQ